MTVLYSAASRQAVPGGGSHCAGLRFAQTPLRCSLQGRAAELATRALRAALEQPRRVSLRSALRAPTLRLALQAAPGPEAPRARQAQTVRRDCLCPGLASSSPQRSPPPGTACREAGCRRATGGVPTLVLQRRARIPGNAPLKRRAAQGMRPRALARSLTDSPRLSERSAQRVASSAVGRLTEQHRAVAAGDRFSEALTGVRARLCREVQRGLCRTSENPA